MSCNSHQNAGTPEQHLKKLKKLSTGSSLVAGLAPGLAPFFGFFFIT